MFRSIGLAWAAMAAVGLSMVSVDGAQARHLRDGGSCGSWGSVGGGGSFGRVFSRHANGGWRDGHSYGFRDGYGSCGSHGGAYYGGSNINGVEHNEYDSERAPDQPPPAPEMNRRSDEDSEHGSGATPGQDGEGSPSDSNSLP